MISDKVMTPKGPGTLCAFLGSDIGQLILVVKVGDAYHKFSSLDVSSIPDPLVLPDFTEPSPFSTSLKESAIAMVKGRKKRK